MVHLTFYTFHLVTGLTAVVMFDVDRRISQISAEQIFLAYDHK